MANIKPGQIIKYCDMLGRHTAVFLRRINRTQSLLLFCTSNPNWNYHSRLLSEDEVCLLGFPITEKKTYFAPVIRDDDYIYITDKVFPNHRVIELLFEFSDDYLVPEKWEDYKNEIQQL